MMNRYDLNFSKHSAADHIDRASGLLHSVVMLLDKAAKNPDACFALNGNDAVALIDMQLVDQLRDLAERLTEEADQEDRLDDARLADRILSEMPDRPKLRSA